MEKFKFELNEEESLGAELSPAVTASLRLVEKLMQSDEAACAIFKDVARLVVDDITTEELNMVIRDTFERGCELQICRLPDALMMCAPFPNRCKDITRPVLYFDVFLACSAVCKTTAEQVRQQYLHFVKLLHELSLALTPALMRLRASRTAKKSYNEMPLLKAKTPPKIGQLHAHLGDMGSALEEELFGGRIVPNGDKLKKPFSTPLRLRTAIDASKIADTSNSKLVDIKDFFITKFLSAVQLWQPGQFLCPFVIPYKACVSPDVASHDLSAAAETPSTKGSKRKISPENRSAPSNYVDITEYTQIMQGDEEESDEAQDEGSVSPKGVMLGGAYTDEQMKYIEKGFRF